MTDTGIKLTIAFTDLELEPEEREEQAQQLIADLKQLDEGRNRRLSRCPQPGRKT